MTPQQEEGGVNPDDREYEVEFDVTLLVTDRGLKPSADQLRHHLLNLGATLASENVDLLNVIVEEYRV